MPQWSDQALVAYRHTGAQNISEFVLETKRIPLLETCTASAESIRISLMHRFSKTWVSIYEAVATREAKRLQIAVSTVEAFVHAFCFIGRETGVHFRVRPFLADPGDDFLLELAVGGSADAIVTHNVRHFTGVRQFGMRVMTPGESLRTIGNEGI